MLDAPRHRSQTPLTAARMTVVVGSIMTSSFINGINGMGFHPPRPAAPIQNLPDELIRDILDHIEADPEKLVSLDRRQYLSQESFRPPPPPSTAFQRAVDVGHFRLACRRFADLGAVHQFARVTTRFSQKGLARLDGIASQPHLAKNVKKFSYMVPYFYVEGRQRLRELLPTLDEPLGPLDVRHFVRKLTEQKEIVATQKDLKVLKRALSAFTSLQHVQILRVLDREDAALLNYIRRNDSMGQLVQLNWVPACSHSTKTLGTALLASESPCSRFSSPMLSPQSAAALLTELEPQERENGHSSENHVQPPHNTQRDSRPSPQTHLSPRFPAEVGTLASRLTCLELHFDDSGGTDDLDAKMTALSSLFKAVFTAAHNMQALHVGFPSHRPLSLRLEHVFHHVRFDKLLAFGIQAWKLDADEVLALARRHRDRLKGLRLRDVLLNDGSLWKDVLVALRREMVRLDWVSLRRIGYARFFDEQWAAAGAEVPDDPPGGDSDSEEEDGDDDDGSSADSDADADWDQHGDTNGDAPHDDDDHLPLANGNGFAHHDDDDFHDDYYDDHDAPSTIASTPRSTASDHGPGAHELDFPPLSPDTPSSVPWCSCAASSSSHHSHHSRHHCCNGSSAGGGAQDEISPDELGDDGVVVTNAQRKMWEKWVVRRCLGSCCARK